MNVFLNTLLSTENPLLPSITATRVALHLVWAVVLGSGALWLAGKLPRPYRLASGLFVMVWTLMPGSVSPAYWLGLAFQTPSLMSAVLCLGWFLMTCTWREPEAGVPLRDGELLTLKILGAAGIVLGWVLLLDTLAWLPLPVSVYAWGFSSVAVGAVAVLATLLWVLWGAGAPRMAPGRLGPWLTLGVLTLFVLTRLPTGNVWDALLDPWLWGALQVGWLVNVARRWRAASRSSPATRA